MGRLSSFSWRPVRAPWRMVAVVVLLAVTVLVLVGGDGSLQQGVLMMAPALALVVLMLARPYLGERAISRLRARGARGSVVAACARRQLPSRRTAARGGRLIATALAGRAPPPALAGCR
jgi:hypothetical protein